MKPLLYVAGAAAGIFLISAAAKAAIAKNLNVVIAGLKIAGSITSPQLIITLGIQNPSSLDYTLYSMSGNVFINGQMIGNASNFQTVTAKANSQTAYAVTVRLGLLEIAQQVLNVFQGNIEATIQMQGTVNVEHVPLPIDLTYQII